MAHRIHKPSSEDIIQWADGSWCYRYELEDFGKSKSDDFVIIYENDAEYKKFQ